MKLPRYNGSSHIAQSAFFYGWVIVASCTIIQVMQYGIQYSFGVFFKPLIYEFGWSRAATSGVYSVLMISAGVTAIPLGWFADKFGPAKVTAICGIIMGIGLILASQVKELWQLYLTFGLTMGIGIGGTMPITGGVTARWFVKKRGLALGIVSAGIGLGTLIMPPIAERLITTFGWSKAYLLFGIATGVITAGSALFLRRDPEEIGVLPHGVEKAQTGTNMDHHKNAYNVIPEGGMSLRDAIRTSPLWMLCFIFFLMNICVQVIMVHLVNYATDHGIDPLTASTLISVIGIGGILGRLVMGTVSDRIGSHNALLITCLLLVASLVWLIFSKQIWMLYLFTIFFGFAYGGEVPQIPLLIGKFFGLQAIMALGGATSSGIRAGGALGSWIGGEIFDITHSYTFAFTTTAITSVFALITAIMLKKVEINVRR